MAKYFLWYKINGTYCMAAWRYEISLLMLKQYFTASSKAYPSFSVGLLLIIPLLRKAWTKFL